MNWDGGSHEISAGQTGQWLDSVFTAIDEGVIVHLKREESRESFGYFNSSPIRSLPIVSPTAVSLLCSSAKGDLCSNSPMASSSRRLGLWGGGGRKGDCAG